MFVDEEPFTARISAVDVMNIIHDDMDESPNEDDANEVIATMRHNHEIIQSEIDEVLNRWAKDAYLDL